MRILIAGLTLLCLAGCASPLPRITNDEIISETHKCEQAGLGASVSHVYSQTDVIPTHVECVPKGDKQ